MAKFVIKCTKNGCENYVQVSKYSIFMQSKVTCACGEVIDIKSARMASRICLHCGNNVVFDQAKGDKALCPVCKEKINTSDNIFSKVQFSCPSCSCELSADKNATDYTCPLCDTVIKVQEQVEKERVKNKGFASIIKYEGNNDTFVWKHPIEDFNFGSQLIVHESQEAIFFRDGQALDLFGAGRYSLETQNLPLLEKLYRQPVNGDTIFHSEIYFINKAVQMGIKWGTDSKVGLFDPATGIHVEIGACGQFNLMVSDSRKVLIKLIGTAKGFSQGEIFGNANRQQSEEGEISTSEKNQGNAYFKALIITKVKSNIARIIKENDINILEVDEYLDLISEKLRISINESLADYGMFMPEFFVTNIMPPDDDRKFKELKQQHADMYLKSRQEQILKAEAEARAERQKVEAQTAAQVKKIDAQAEAEAYKLKAAAEAEEMRLKGYTYQMETSRQVGLGAVENMGNLGGAGGLGDLAGLGISIGAMSGIVNMTKDAISPVSEKTTEIGNGISSIIENTWDCTCGNKSIVGNFCNMCGKKRIVLPDEWDCSCGNKQIVGNFCNMCGAKRMGDGNIWNCVCGNKVIKGNFCNNCGKKRGE